MDIEAVSDLRLGNALTGNIAMRSTRRESLKMVMRVEPVWQRFSGKHHR
jgi:hypothetical protein